MQGQKVAYTRYMPRRSIQCASLENRGNSGVTNGSIGRITSGVTGIGGFLGRIGLFSSRCRKGSKSTG